MPERICSVEDCDRPVAKRGWCNMHYQRWRTKGTLERTTASHGLSGTPEYKAWTALRLRCLDPNDASFKDYGARGITVCAAWRDDFMAFYRDMGQRPSSDHTLDRIDNDGPYSPDNCRWATWDEQHANRRGVRRIEYDGRSRTVTQWAAELGLDRSLIYNLPFGDKPLDYFEDVPIPELAQRYGWEVWW